MKKIKKQKQVVVIYADKYEVIYTHTDPELVVEFAKANRKKLKKNGALKVITNYGFYNV